MILDPEAELLLVRAQLQVLRDALNDQAAARVAERKGRIRAEETVIKALRLIREGELERAQHCLQVAVNAAKAAKAARKYYDPG